MGGCGEMAVYSVLFWSVGLGRWVEYNSGLKKKVAEQQRDSLASFGRPSCIQREPKKEQRKA